MNFLILLIAIIIFVSLCFYYGVWVQELVNKQFKSKKEATDNLIPFKMLFDKIKSYWNELK